MRRRGNGEGPIYQRSNGRWVGEVSIGGRRRALYGKTRGEVARRLNAALKAKGDGLPLPGEKQTFAQFTEKWLAAMGPTVKERTATGYAVLLRHHAVPVIGHLPLTKVQPADLTRLYDQRRSAGAAARTVLHLHRVVFRALRFAERWGDVSRNVAAH